MREKVNLNPVRIGKRAPVRLAAESLVRTGYLDPQKRMPLVIEPALGGINLVEWAQSDRRLIEAELLRHGAVLFRRGGVGSVETFQQFVRAVCGELLTYSEPSSPRTEVASQVYTSTDYPADQWIQMHNEMSYSHRWPAKVFFFCAQPAERGGATPIANGHEVWQRIPPAIRDEFEAKQVMYTRNFGHGLDLSWQHVFNTTSRDAVESYCRDSGISCEWRGDRLRTRQVRQASITHPATGRQVWFNQAHAFHASCLAPVVREALRREMSEDEFPRNAFYGDGSPIEDAVIAEIREVYARASVAFDWQAGDLLLVDNLLVAHGREPFAGKRRILVAMSEMIGGEEPIKEIDHGE